MGRSTSSNMSMTLSFPLWLGKARRRSFGLCTSLHRRAGCFAELSSRVFKPEGQKYGPLVGLVSHGWLGPSSDIVFIDDLFSTEDNTAGWSPQDWVEKPYATGLATGARCATIVNNHFFNLRDAISVSGDQSLIEGNLIEDIGNDGIDLMASDLLIRGNRIRNGRHSPAEPLHADGIQGWTIRGATNRNIVIDFELDHQYTATTR